VPADAACTEVIVFGGAPKAAGARDLEIANLPDGGRASSEQVYRYVVELHSRGYDTESYEDEGPSGEDRILQHREFVLRRLPRGSVDCPWETMGSVSQEYADMQENFPPIVVDSDLTVIDGYQRVAAAEIRGEDTIRAFVPVGNPRTTTGSHKQTPWRENTYCDTDEEDGRWQGEGTQGYALQPECVEDSKAGLPLGELLNQTKIGY
jgi:hypothetical protein